MTREDLEKLKSLKHEVRQLQGELKHLPMTTDSIKGSMDEFPYIECTMKIVGIDEDKAKKLRKKLERKLDKLQDMIDEMEDWLDTVEDPEIRTIIRMKYRDGLTFKQISIKLGYDKSSISKKVSKFFESA